MLKGSVTEPSPYRKRRPQLRESLTLFRQLATPAQMSRFALIQPKICPYGVKDAGLSLEQTLEAT